jgi:hypothetical protein
VVPAFPVDDPPPDEVEVMLEVDVEVALELELAFDVEPPPVPPWPLLVVAFPVLVDVCAVESSDEHAGEPSAMSSATLLQCENRSSKATSVRNRDPTTTPPVTGIGSKDR